MVLGVLERPADFLFDALDQIRKFSIFMKWQLDFDHRGQTIEPFSYYSRFTFWDQLCYLVQKIIFRLSVQNCLELFV